MVEVEFDGGNGFGAEQRYEQSKKTEFLDLHYEFVYVYFIVYVLFLVYGRAAVEAAVLYCCYI